MGLSMGLKRMSVENIMCSTSIINSCGVNLKFGLKCGDKEGVTYYYCSRCFRNEY